MVLSAGIKAAGPSAARPQLMKSLEALNLELGGFRVAFNSNTRQGSKFTEMTVIAKNGRVAR